MQLDSQFDEIQDTLLEELHSAKEKHEGVLWSLVEFYSRAGMQARALDYAYQYSHLAEDSDQKAGCFLALGQLMEQLYDYENAILMYLKALKWPSNDEEKNYLINNNLGYCLNQFDKYYEAERFCRAAIKIIPERYNAHKNLGVSLAGQGDFRGAVACFLSSVKANPSNRRALTLLENLVENHVELLSELPDLASDLECCRRIVAKAEREAAKGRDDIAASN